jgi:20S proteasome subunit beta 6
MTSLIVKELPSTYVNDDYRTVAKQAGQWSPYITNEGTTLAISGKDFAIVAGDTRMSDGGYSIISRSQSKLFQYASHCVLGSSGMQSDVNTLQKLLKTRAIQYQQRHHNELTTESCAQLLSNTLYYRRFFPYYSFNVMGGVDSQGRGAAYGYDAVGEDHNLHYILHIYFLH